jgi:uncharacterized membrane protein YfcA
VFDPFVILSGAGVGFVVGLTGMGGGALMTPILVLLFGIEPLTAVSSDIVASMVMKPIGGAVHWKRGTVHKPLVKWLMLGSIPTAFLGVLLLRKLGSGVGLQGGVKTSLGVALLVVVTGLVVKPLLGARRRPGDSIIPFEVKPLPTLLIGIVGGLIVGITSVGSGSLIIIMLMMLYPRMKLSELVGTDLVQAVPLVTSAALGHLLFGSFKLGLTASILIGSVPGVFIGARFSSRAPDYLIRPALMVVLLLSGLKLVNVPNKVLAAIAPIVIVSGVVYTLWAWRGAKRAHVARAEAQTRAESLSVAITPAAPVTVAGADRRIV